MKLLNGIYQRDGKPLNGKIRTKLPNGDTRLTIYRDGLLDGKEVVEFSNGRLAEERYYTAGKKTGIHKGWYENGHFRFLSHFRNGEYDGDQWEWHENGRPLTYAKYRDGSEIGRKVWRSNGQIYMNYVVNKGRNIGMEGSRLCDPLLEQKQKQAKTAP